MSARTLLIAAVLVLAGSTALAVETGGAAFADDTSAHHSHDYFDQGRCDDSAEILTLDEQLECRGTY